MRIDINKKQKITVIAITISFLFVVLFSSCASELQGKLEPNFSKQWALFNDGSGGTMEISPEAEKLNTCVEGIDINVIPMWKAIDNENEEVVVAIIDSGVDFTHEDLVDASWTNINEKPGDGIDNDGNGYIDDIHGWDFVDNVSSDESTFDSFTSYHGTACAGIIAAGQNKKGIAGISPNGQIKIMSLKVLKDANETLPSGNIANLISAIEYAEKMGARVCNLSFCSEIDYPKLQETMEKSSMLFVVSAGNNNNIISININIDKKPVFPASYMLINSISVANIGFDGRIYKKSNVGKQTVDIAAPGVNVLSTSADNNYAYYTGTSIAVPHVSGVAATLFLVDSDITAPEVKNIIVSSATKRGGLKNVVKSGGILNAGAAIEQLKTDISI